jgi:hypothetical protein
MEADKLHPFLSLPAELIHHILRYLQPLDLVSLAGTCRLLHQHTLSDHLWQPHVQSNVPGAKINDPGVFPTFRDLYIAFHPFWFLSRNKIWFSNQTDLGKLIIVRYDPRTNAIEGYALTAGRGHHTFEFWQHNHEVIIHTFNPKVQLDLNLPVLRLNPASLRARVGDGKPLQKEFPMYIHNNNQTSAGLFSRLMLTRPWPSHITGRGSTVWPPLIMPSAARCQNASFSGYSALGHKPERLSDCSTSTFRIRRWMEFYHGAVHGVSMRVGEDVSTWASLPRDAYTPTRRKPWRGIWCGDYAGHGCEFLAILQPDDPLPLPEGAQRTLECHRAESVSSDGSWQTAQTNLDGVAPGPATTAAEGLGEEQASQRDGVPNELYSGRLEAIKLTGDPNIPRGEYTFIAPDVGDEGLIRVAQEEQFKGARIVRSVGHIAARAFREGKYHGLSACFFLSSMWFSSHFFFLSANFASY